MIRLGVVDVEGTGPDPFTDAIVELSIVAVDLEEGPSYTIGEKRTRRVKPWKPIPETASAIHGITNEDVAELPMFGAYARAVAELLEAFEVLAGYHSRNYDIPILHEELRRVGLDGFPTDEMGDLLVRELDLHRAWTELEPRTLEGAVLKFLHREHEGAHGAEADAIATAELIPAMAEAFDVDLAMLEELSKPAWEVDRAGKFRRRDDGVVEFAFGPHRGAPVTTSPGFLEWMIGKDFAPNTKAWARVFLQDIAAEAGSGAPR